MDIARFKTEHSPLSPGLLRNQIGDRWLEVLGDLCPDLEEAIDEVGGHVSCPMHGGNDGFRLFDDAAATGGGICNTCGPFSDGFSLLMEINGWSFPETLKAIGNWLREVKGHDNPKTGHSTSKDLRAVSKSSAEPDTRIQDNLSQTISDSKHYHPRLNRYLNSRGLTVAAPSTLLFNAAEMYIEDGNCAMELPAMIAPIQDIDGQVVCLLRTYLDKNTDGKALVKTAKKFTKAIYKGAISGAAIRLVEPTTLLGVAEGIETALAVFEATGTPMWATCSAGGLKSIDIPAGVEHVEIWADHDRNGAGQNAAMKLAKRLYGAGLSVCILLPPSPGMDWLDVFNQQDEDAFWDAISCSPVFRPSKQDEVSLSVSKIAGVESAQAQKSLPGENEDFVDILNKIHFVAHLGGKGCIFNEDFDPVMGRRDITVSTPADHRLRYSNKKIDDQDTWATAWLKSGRRRQYKGIVFSPGHDVPGYYNLFQGFSVEPVAGDCSLYWEHVRTVLCRGNNLHYEYLCKWMAHLIQFPSELPGVAIVVRGKQGTGKGVFVDQLGALLGVHYLVLYRLEQLTGRFNSHQKDILLVNANEAIWGGDKSGEGALKGIITDISVPIEFKGKDIITVKNYKRLIVTSNEDWAVPMGIDDRRFLVLEASDAHKEDKMYFKAIVDQMNNGGREALMHDLLNEDLTGFDVRTAPHSRHSFDIKLRGADPIVKWWYEKLFDGLTVGVSNSSANEEWNMLPPKAVLFEDFVEFCTLHKMRTIGQSVFGKKLRELLPGLSMGESRPNIDVPTGLGPGQVLIRKRVKCYELPSLEDCRQAFEKYTKAASEIWPTQTGQSQVDK